mgnify:CR=1 FL=1
MPTAPQKPESPALPAVFKLVFYRGARGRSSVGSALAWHARGRRFDPDRLHLIRLVWSTRTKLTVFRLDDFCFDATQY